MKTVELLTVIDRFQLTGIGLTVMPDFPVPKRWNNRVEQVIVATPDGRQFEAVAQFNLTHFNIKDPQASVGRGWRILVTLPTTLKDQVPLGSRFFVGPEVRDALLRDA
jgi:hypothetical protein